MTTAVVLSGGANLGAVHVGMLRAIVEHGVVPDLIVGTSVGALNGAYISSRWDREGVAGLDAIWTGLRRQDILPTNLVGGFLGFVGRSDHLVSNDGVRRVVERELGFDRLEQAPIPVHVVATDLLTGIDRRFSSGPAVDAILASTAIPAIFPPVVIERHSVHRRRCGEQHADHPRRRARGDHHLGLTGPVCPVTVSPTDFGQARQLIDRAYTDANAWLHSHAQTSTGSRASQAATLDHGHHVPGKR